MPPALRFKSRIRAARSKRVITAALLALALGTPLAVVMSATPAQAVTPNYTINVKTTWADDGSTATSGVNVPFKVSFFASSADIIPSDYCPPTYVGECLEYARPNEKMEIDLVATNGRFPYPLPENCFIYMGYDATSTISKDRTSLTCYTAENIAANRNFLVTPQWEGANVSVTATVRGVTQTTGFAGPVLSRAVNVVGTPPPPEYFLTQGTVSVGGDTTFPGTMTAQFDGWSPAPTLAKCSWAFGSADVVPIRWVGASRDCSWTPTREDVGGRTNPRVLLEAWLTYGGDHDIRVTAEIAYNDGARVPNGDSSDSVYDETYGKQIKLLSKPKVTGKKMVGKYLKVRGGKVNVAGAKITYRWLRAGRKIAGAAASKATYRVTKADLRKRLTCKVTFSKKGYKTLKVRAK